MTPEDGYKIIKKKYPLGKLAQCLDFGDFYVYIFSPIMSEDPVISGYIFDAVEKRSGKPFLYNLTDDVEAYYNSTEIKIEDVMDKIIE